MGRVSTIGRALFGGVLAFMAFDNFRDMEGTVAYADSNDVPEADKLVPFASGALLVGGSALATGKARKFAAGAIATFFVGVTPGMHDFWNMDDEQREGQLIHFLKNLALLGAALSFLAREDE
ncbi:DoxX family protein [Halococcus sp. AFM35]|uniref:DoxX family protein n=1 Tax=Halococcus sp. AFM35 TaxID=3421653 RepID=UPI003EBC046B